ncbi:MAG: hypothetical protein Cons2KO_27340 [Congregibacter sp.]
MRRHYRYQKDADRTCRNGLSRRTLARRDADRRVAADIDRPDSVEEKARYLPLSRTTDRVLEILLEGDLSRLRAESVAESMGISCTTLRRRLRNDHTSYQFLLDRARQYRCESRLRERWLPGKCFADELGYLEVNSFYRAFRRWTGMSYSAYKDERL